MAAAATATLGYAAGVELRWFRLRRYEVPVLPQGRRPVRILHISDAHLTPSQRRKMAWLRALDATSPDLVVNTGDSIAHEDAVPAFLSALGPLLDRPGVFVFGSNDYYAPQLKNPFRYLWQSGRLGEPPRGMLRLPWGDLRSRMTAAGWLDATHRRHRLRVGDIDVEVTGVDDSHIGLDRYDTVAGPVDSGADVHIGMMHSPEPANLDAFAADGYELLLAGHTHGGQVCVPGYGAVITNCGIDRARARGLHRHNGAWLHVSAGLGTSPYAPIRFACPPEATLLTLLPRVR
ncbi:MAG: metallophosphoesterase [Streptosporangiales bacterium]|nr:metallophosphoesterase [Streptosporangiales bacterium]